MKKINGNTSGGASGSTLLQIAFIVLKLCNVIAWSWWWVMSPLFITLGLSIILLILLIITKNKQQ